MWTTSVREKAREMRQKGARYEDICKRLGKRIRLCRSADEHGWVDVVDDLIDRDPVARRTPPPEGAIEELGIEGAEARIRLVSAEFNRGLLAPSRSAKRRDGAANSSAALPAPAAVL